MTGLDMIAAPFRWLRREVAVADEISSEEQRLDAIASVERRRERG